MPPARTSSVDAPIASAASPAPAASTSPVGAPIDAPGEARRKPSWHQRLHGAGPIGIFRAFLTWFSNGGAITLDGKLSDVYGPVYYGSWLGIPVPIWVFAVVALIGAYMLNRTRYGRYVQAIGSNEQVARYAAVA